MTTTLDPHANTPVHHAGAPLASAAGAIVLLHGRGASADDILALGDAIHQPRLALVAPQAAGHTWYPNSFLAPREANEPYLSSALKKIASVVTEIESAGITRDRIVIAGFSQGACLSTEFVASNPARYAGLIAFTGGLIGPLGTDLHHEGQLAGTPVLLLGGDPDPHVPWQRIEDSARELNNMGAVVQAIRYPGRPHTVSAPEIDQARQLLQQAFAA
ncbi:phospholipase [Granulicella sp. 5B5]|uniref:alpha/beta hydrolase n=1 Tax=Granulicella sp. 5B5 TaxID=1617967 RepID=UPI0015F66B04|nr:dienelactone hydrolase family protein [Granulicella sp. 5B5]QMV19500.1 phospholipase [Granulicella sp. 5B5]